MSEILFWGLTDFERITIGTVTTILTNHIANVSDLNQTLEALQLKDDIITLKKYATLVTNLRSFGQDL